MTTPAPTTLVNLGWDDRSLVAPSHLTELAREITGADIAALVLSVEGSAFGLEEITGRKALAYQWSVIPWDRWSVDATSPTSDFRWCHLERPLPGLSHALVAFVASPQHWVTVGLLVAHHDPLRGFTPQHGPALAQLAAHPSVRGTVDLWLTTKLS